MVLQVMKVLADEIGD